MRVAPLATCLWPGLPRLWYRGDERALLRAVGFGTALSVVLASTFLQPPLLPDWLNSVVWVFLGGVWSVSAVRSYRGFAEVLPREGHAERDLFLRARDEYLKGHWYEAETLLQQLLSRSHRDVEAHLMLATLYRHTKRLEEATGRLQMLERLEGSERWRWELQHERQMLKRLSETAIAAEEDTQQTSSPDSPGGSG